MYGSVVTAAAAALALCTVILFWKAGYLHKLMAKIGAAQYPVKQNWTAFSWESCLRKMDCCADIVFFGDSIVRGGNFHEHFLNAKILNLGCTGNTLADLIARVPMLQAVMPAKVFLLGGINGLTDFNRQQCLAQYEALLLAIKKALPTAKIYAHSILPVSKKQERKICKNRTIHSFNRGVEALAEKYGLVYIDINPLYLREGEMDFEKTVDGIHLQPEAYADWYAALEPYID